MRKVTLREEHDGNDHRHLEAYVDGDGNLHIDGHDLGPATEGFSADGEYEWFSTIRAADVPRLLVLLGGQGEILDVLAQRYTGANSYELERIVRESGIPVTRHVWRD
jgi:hypothetical protein